MKTLNINRLIEEFERASSKYTDLAERLKESKEFMGENAEICLSRKKLEDLRSIKYLVSTSPSEVEQIENRIIVNMDVIDAYKALHSYEDEEDPYYYNSKKLKPRKKSSRRGVVHWAPPVDEDKGDTILNTSSTDTDEPAFIV